MEKDTSKTPYNSIYEALNGKNLKQDAEVQCCKHGTQCPYGRGKPPTEKKPNDNQYVNLPEPSKEQQVAEKLTAKLQKLVVEEQNQEKSLVEKPKKKGSVRGSKDKRKKKKPVVEDGQPYEMLGPPTEESTNSSATAVTSAPASAPSDQPPPFQLGDAHSAYIGACTPADAEVRVTQRGEFALYHLFESNTCLNNLGSGLSLMLVYFTTTKKHRHYPIRTCGSTFELQFYVDCGYPNLRKHYSLNQLVKYYKTSGAMDILPEETFADAFTWWLE